MEIRLHVQDMYQIDWNFKKHELNIRKSWERSVFSVRFFTFLRTTLGDR